MLRRTYVRCWRRRHHGLRKLLLTRRIVLLGLWLWNWGRLNHLRRWCRVLRVLANRRIFSGLRLRLNHLRVLHRLRRRHLGLGCKGLRGDWLLRNWLLRNRLLRNRLRRWVVRLRCGRLRECWLGCLILRDRLILWLYGYSVLSRRRIWRKDGRRNRRR